MIHDGVFCCHLPFITCHLFLTIYNNYALFILRCVKQKTSHLLRGFGFYLLVESAAAAPGCGSSCTGGAFPS
jgi:hypothetical protein